MAANIERKLSAYNDIALLLARILIAILFLIAAYNKPLLSFPGGALVHFAVSNTDVRMVTKLEGPATSFLPFNQGNDGAAGNPPNPSGHPTAYLWEQVWVFNKFSFGAAASIVLLAIFGFLIFFGIYMLARQGNAAQRNAA